MKTVLTYNPKDYRSRSYGLTFASRAQRNGLNPQIKREGKRHSVQFDDSQYELAVQVFQKYQEDKNNEAEQFKKAIKIRFGKSKFDKGEFVVDSLYATLKRNGIENIYLPDGWKGGRAIQNYSQNDFYSFSFVNIENSKTLNGNKVYVSMLSKKSVWILPVNFQSQIAGCLEDARNARQTITSLDQILDMLAEKTMSGEAMDTFVKHKQIYHL